MTFRCPSLSSIVSLPLTQAIVDASGVAPSGNHGRPSEGHVSISTSPSGLRFILSGSKDGSVMVWDCTTQHSCQKVLLPLGEVWALALTPDQTHVVVGRKDGLGGGW